MKVRELIHLYQEEPLVHSIASDIQGERKSVALKGLTGSQDAVVAASIYTTKPKHMVFVMHDKEEASYFQNDLQFLIEDKEVLLFPSSYKKPYQFQETENANILMRSEVLNHITDGTSQGELIVTFPEALCEKVINKRSLVANTFVVKAGEKLDPAFVDELLGSYDFEKSDFVFEPGQYSIRGGIIDIYSYSQDLPYRIELFGDEIESIRTFDPESQLSVEHKQSFSLIPNVQTRLLQEKRESLLEFLPKDTVIWFKDLALTLDVLEKSFEKVSSSYKEALKETGGSKLIIDPAQLFDSRETFLRNVQKTATIEFGNQFLLKPDRTYTFSSFPQPSFNKEFTILVDDLNNHQQKGFRNVIVAESFKQIERLSAIFEELDPYLRFEPLTASFRQGFIDENLRVVCYTDHQIFDRFHSYREKEKHSKSKAITLRELRTLQPGDFVTHADYGIGRFAGMEKVDVGGKHQEAIRLIFRDDDIVLLSIHSLHKISKYSGKEGGPPALSKLGSTEWDNKKKKVKKQVQDIAKELIGLYAKRKAVSGFAFSEDSYLQAELESSFIYEDTPDQAKATTEVKEDMENPHPMDRLVCGDVGFGKTEVAIRAAFKAACDGKQVAVLVPTTILAMQHYKTFKERLGNLPCLVEYINRFKTPQQIKETLKRVEEGKTNILIGTHRIIGKDVKFKDLGLLIIDEEQKFGVKVKDKLKEFKINVDTLTLTATPIPRTLHFSLMGARDLSIISTPPPNRQPVSTEIHVFNETVIRDAISSELKRGGQVFMVHNRVKDIEALADLVVRMVPDAKVGIAHGQMDGPKLEKAMMKFVEGDYDVLVSTNIIESGLDIPNANTIIINMAHMFGLSDLHQMRGRVGRSNKKAFCYLLTPPVSTLPADSRKRLSALEEFSELGAGFKVAMRDLDIRGAGNLLGAEQSGFITDLGFEMYHKILDEAIQELKETEFRELFQKELETSKLKIAQDCLIETDLAVVIPEDYVSNISERLQLYNTLDNIRTQEELEQLREGIRDRFGPLPEEVKDLVEIVRLRWRAEQLGFEKVTLKNETMRCYFIAKEEYFKSETFGTILQFAQQNSKRCRLKEINGKPMLAIEQISNIKTAIEVLESINAVPVMR